jgi:hypothetical protein
MIQESDKARVAECSPLIEIGQETFRKSIADLLKSHRGKWVAFLGEEVVCFAKTETDAYRQCIARGLSIRDVAVRRVAEPHWEEDVKFS